MSPTNAGRVSSKAVPRARALRADRTIPTRRTHAKCIHSPRTTPSQAQPTATIGQASDCASATRRGPPPLHSPHGPKGEGVPGNKRRPKPVDARATPSALPTVVTRTRVAGGLTGRRSVVGGRWSVIASMRFDFYLVSCALCPWPLPSACRFQRLSLPGATRPLPWRRLSAGRQ